ncbi:hypothetical protein [Nocardia sp. SC052]|uniref:hypothetical protein n=1 Tax=Nocardia sichangensis TaxID=3385975 RepID=UPI00399F56D5
MSGTAEPVTPPATDAEWARDTTRRLESLENPTSVRVGPWVLSASTEGHLVGSHVEGGSVILARKPGAGENDPDAIEDPIAATLGATRTAEQNIGTSGAAVIWDGTAVEVGGDWTRGQTMFDSVVVPKTGAYWVSANIHFKTRQWLSVSIRADGVPVAGGRVDNPDLIPWVTVPPGKVVGLVAGQRVDVFVIAETSTVIGANAFFSPGVPSSLDMFLIAERG